MKKIALLFFFIPFIANATPKKIEMIFLSPAKVAQLMNTIENMSDLKKYKHIAQNEMDNCVPMGDGCFNPQYGYIENAQMKKNENAKPKLIQDDEIKLKTINAVETNLIDCDKKNYFDIYCGEARAKAKTFETEIWFDISTSLREVDYNSDPNYCNRRAFLEKIVKACPGKVDFSIYNTSLKQVGDYSSVCLSYGSNDERRLISWMKDTTVNRLLLVTDIDEMSAEMRSFLDQNGAKMIGDGVKGFTSADLVQYANEFIKGCK